MRLIFFFFFPFILYSQESKLSGTFCNPVPIIDIGQCFTFNFDQKFTWNKGSHMPPDIFGNGTYEIIKNKLILKYQTGKAYDFSFYKKSKRVSLDEMINISFIVKDLNHKPLTNVQIGIIDNRGYLLNRILLDKNGEGELRCDSSDELIRLEITRIGFQTLILETNTNDNYIINAFLSSIDQKLTVESHQDTLLILKRTLKHLVLENSEGSVMEFSKVSL